MGSSWLLPAPFGPAAAPPGLLLAPSALMAGPARMLPVNRGALPGFDATIPGLGVVGWEMQPWPLSVLPTMAFPVGEVGELKVPAPVAADTDSAEPGP